MRKFKCVIVDDEELARELIESHIAQLDQFEVVASCSSAIEASAALKSEQIDLMFLDIEMPMLKGTDFYRNLLIKPKVIFTTAYRDYALDGFDLDAVDYLLKPIVFSRFFQAIERFLATENVRPSATKEKTETLPDHIFVRKDRKQVKIEFAHIVYVKGMKDYVQVFLEDGTHVIKQKIGALEQQLGSGFLRTHRSYIVNKSRVTALTKNDVELGDIEIPIGEQFKNRVFETI